MVAENNAFDSDQDAMAAEWAAALDEQSRSDGAAPDAGRTDALTGSGLVEPVHNMAPSAFANFNAGSTSSPAPAAGNDINLILDIPVQLTVELGRTRIPIKNILQLAQGSVVELDALAGEPMDVLVNGYLIAQGEVVVVNDKFGIRLTDIVTPSDRIRRLSRGG